MYTFLYCVLWFVVYGRLSDFCEFGCYAFGGGGSIYFFGLIRQSWGHFDKKRIPSPQKNSSRVPVHSILWIRSHIIRP